MPNEENTFTCTICGDTESEDNKCYRYDFNSEEVTDEPICEGCNDEQSGMQGDYLADGDDYF